MNLDDILDKEFHLEKRPGHHSYGQRGGLQRGSWALGPPPAPHCKGCFCAGALPIPQLKY